MLFGSIVSAGRERIIVSGSMGSAVVPSAGASDAPSAAGVTSSLPVSGRGRIMLFGSIVSAGRGRIIVSGSMGSAAVPSADVSGVSVPVSAVLVFASVNSGRARIMLSGSMGASSFSSRAMASSIYCSLVFRQLMAREEL